MVANSYGKDSNYPKIGGFSFIFKILYLPVFAEKLTECSKNIFGTFFQKHEEKYAKSKRKVVFAKIEEETYPCLIFWSLSVLK
jgi:hypothetical protein